MSNKVQELIKYSAEGHSLDYKKTQYNLSNPKEKQEFLKDALSFLNHPSVEDKYIIIGVKSKDNLAESFHDIGDLQDQAAYQQILNSNIEPEVNFEYNSIVYNDVKLAYFRFFNNNQQPYLFKKVGSAGASNKPGTGYIRVGTTTRELLRDDFEGYYKARNVPKDRKADLEVNPVLFYPEREFPRGLKGLDIMIKNLSNKSLKFDIDLKIYKNNDFSAYNEHNAKKLVLDPRSDSTWNSWRGGLFPSPNIDLNFECSLDEKSDYYLLTKNRKIDSTNTSVIHQADVIEAIFGKYLYVYNRINCDISIEIIVKSDDFTEGPLIIQ